MRAWVHDRSLGDMLELVREREKTPPFGFVLAWITDRIGHDPTWMRVPSLASGTALIPLAGVLGRRTFGPAAGLAAAGVVSASPFMVFLSVEARSYSLVTALCCGATLMLLASVERGGALRWSAYGLLSVAALLTHYIAAALLVCLVAWVLAVRPHARRAVLLAQIPTLTAIALLWGTISTQVANADDYLSRMHSAAPLSVDTVARILGQAGMGHPFATFAQVPGSLGLVLVAAGIAGAAVLALAARRRRTAPSAWRDSGNERWLIVGLALSTPVMLLALSAIPGQSVLMPRNLIPSMPAAAVLLGGLLAAGGRRSMLVPGATLIWHRRWSGFMPIAAAEYRWAVAPPADRGTGARR